MQAGQRVLIHGAGGGVGSFAVQFARWKGAQVIGTTSKANMDFVRSLGAETVIDCTSTPFEQMVHDVDLVLDTIGGETLQRSMQVVKHGGTLVSLESRGMRRKPYLCFATGDTDRALSPEKTMRYSTRSCSSSFLQKVSAK